MYLDAAAPTTVPGVTISHVEASVGSVHFYFDLNP